MRAGRAVGGAFRVRVPPFEAEPAAHRELRRLRGTVSVEEPTGAPLVVLIYTGDADTAHVIDDFVLTQPGAFFFMLPAGTYRLAAFEDHSRTFAYDPAHDPAVRFAVGEPLTLAEGQVIDQIALVLHAGSTEQLGFAYTVPEAGRRGRAPAPRHQRRSRDDARRSAASLRETRARGCGNRSIFSSTSAPESIFSSLSMKRRFPCCSFMVRWEVPPSGAR